MVKDLEFTSCLEDLKIVMQVYMKKENLALKGAILIVKFKCQGRLREKSHNLIPGLKEHFSISH